MLNKIGDKIPPCITPLCMAIEFFWSKEVILVDVYIIFILLMISGGIINFSNLVKSIFQFTMSKACLKSKKIMDGLPNLLSLSFLFCHLYFVYKISFNIFGSVPSFYWNPC